MTTTTATEPGAMTAALRRIVTQLHTDICQAVDDQQPSWRHRCACGHYRSRHTAFTHKALPVEDGICTGRNHAGPCLWSHCLCTRYSTLGVIYLLHFDRPYRHARHYTGFTHDLDARTVAHLTGEGARLLQVIQHHGIGWQLARTWPGTRATERRLKNQGGAARRCPLCGIHPRNHRNGGTP
jgi:predicted GIY-YIG superfamily endonuclease